MLEPQGDHSFLDLGGPSARPSRLTSVQKQLGCLLRDSGATFYDRPLGKIGFERSKHRHWIHTGMRPEAPVFGSDRCLHEKGRKAVSREPDATRAVSRKRFVQRHATAVHDDGGGCRPVVEEVGWQRAEPEPERESARAGRLSRPTELRLASRPPPSSHQPQPPAPVVTASPRSWCWRCGRRSRAYTFPRHAPERFETSRRLWPWRRN